MNIIIIAVNAVLIGVLVIRVADQVKGARHESAVFGEIPLLEKAFRCLTVVHPRISPIGEWAIPILPPSPRRVRHPVSQTFISGGAPAAAAAEFGQSRFHRARSGSCD